MNKYKNNCVNSKFNLNDKIIILIKYKKINFFK